MTIANVDKFDRTIFQAIRNYYKLNQFSSTKKQWKHQIIELYKPFLNKMVKIRQLMNLSFATFITAVQLIQRKQVILYLFDQLQSLSRYNKQKARSFQSTNSSGIFSQFQQHFTNNQHLSQKNYYQSIQLKEKLNIFEKQSQRSLSHNFFNIKQKLEWKTSISILYIVHKVVEDLYKKYTIDVWLKTLKMQLLSCQQVLNQQACILQKIDFHVLTPFQSTFQLIQYVLSYLKIFNKKQFMLCQYILQLNISHKQTDFLSFNIKKRIQIILGAIRLACHFLKPYDWNPIILNLLQINQQKINKRCCKLLKLLLEKQKNKEIHEKYQSKQYEQISKIRLVKIRKFSKNSTEIQTEIQQNIVLVQNGLYKQQNKDFQPIICQNNGIP